MRGLKRKPTFQSQVRQHPTQKFLFKMSLSVGFIGFGNMAEAIWKGMSQAGVCEGDSVSVTEANVARSDYIQSKYGLIFIRFLQRHKTGNCW